MSENQSSLWALQDQLAAAEEEVNSADDEKLSGILGDIRAKVDNIKQMIDIFDVEATRFKAYKDEMAKRQKSLENAAERIRQYTISCLRAHGTEFEAGATWIAKISQSERLETYKDAPDDSDYIALGLTHGHLIRRKMEWDKAELKKELKLGNNDLLVYAKLSKTDNLQFKAVNAAKKRA